MSSTVPPGRRADHPVHASVPPSARTADGTRAAAERTTEPNTTAVPRWHTWGLRAGEVLAGPLAAVVLLLLCTRIDVDPLDRVGQVSGLAAVGLRFSVLGLALLSIVLVALRWRAGRWFPQVTRLCCAAAAGLASGFVGSGLLIALSGTTWPLYADMGDAGRLAAWVSRLESGGSMPAHYPPLAVHAMAWYAELTGTSAPSAVRALQIVGTALFAPVVYLAWRLLLRPCWALTAAVVSSLVLVDPYKPYDPLVLAVLVPTLLLLLRAVRCAPALSWASLIRRGGGLGLALGILFLTYSGWLVWSALGAVAAVLLVFPWRSGPARGGALLVITGAAFGVVAFPYLVDLLNASGASDDTYFYFDVYVEPAYIAMWRGDHPGPTGPWPPPGELGGVGVFSLILVTGLGVALWLGGRRTVVIGLSTLLAGAWLMRLWFAQRMFETGEVQLYPRTTQLILYCSLLLVGCAVLFAAERVRRWLATSPGRELRPGSGPGTPAVVMDRRTAVPATLAAVLAFALYAGSASADTFLPRADRTSLGYLAYVAQLVRQPDGTCPAHAGTACADTSDELANRPVEDAAAPGTP